MQILLFNLQPNKRVGIGDQLALKKKKKETANAEGKLKTMKQLNFPLLAKGYLSRRRYQGFDLLAQTGRDSMHSLR